MSPKVRCLAAQDMQQIESCPGLANFGPFGTEIFGAEIAELWLTKLSVVLCDFGVHGRSWSLCLPRCIAGDHSVSELGEVLTIFGWAGVMGNHAEMLRR